ncbi:MAG: hypothetical protein GVY10_06710 [Verrucomicrobia bacterium]|nr:hypothetical protein [Verrucomicrobiota bacterium]
MDKDLFDDLTQGGGPLLAVEFNLGEFRHVPSEGPEKGSKDNGARGIKQVQGQTDPDEIGEPVSADGIDIGVPEFLASG